MDNSRPFLAHALEVGRLHVPRQVEIKLFVDVALVEQLQVHVFDAHDAEHNFILSVLLVQLPDLTERA